MTLAQKRTLERIDVARCDQCLCMQWALAPSWQPWVRGACAAAVLANSLTLVNAAGRIPRSGYEKDVVKEAIEGSMAPIGLGLLLTAVAA